MFALYSQPTHETPLGVASTQRDRAGSDAPISNVGGNRHTAAINPLNTRPGRPCVAPAKYRRPTSGTANNTSRPNTAIPASSTAYTFSGCRRRDTNRGNAVLPKHNPPM